MNKLIIITGVSGTGKTTLAKNLYKRLENSTLLSYDELIEKIYDTVGFRGKNQKQSLQKINTTIYKSLIEECLKRQDKVVILEKPFKIEWKGFLKDLAEQYDYKVYTINMFSKNFETIWNRLLEREKSKENRHPSHYLDSYTIKKIDEYEPLFEYDYNTFKEEYDELISNSINLGNVIKIEDIEKLDFEELVKNIMG